MVGGVVVVLAAAVVVLVEVEVEVGGVVLGVAAEVVVEVVACGSSLARSAVIAASSAAMADCSAGVIPSAVWMAASSVVSWPTSAAFTPSLV